MTIDVDMIYIKDAVIIATYNLQMSSFWFENI